MSRISGYTYSGTPNDQLKYVSTKVVSSGAVALVTSLEDVNVTLSAGEINVSAFKNTAGTPTDAFLYSNSESLAAVTELWEGIGGYDATANVFRAFPIVLDDSAMPATPAIVPIGGEYRASATTYTDGDATVLQSDINGYLKVATAGVSKYENATYAETEDEANDSEFTTSVMYGLDTEAAANSQLRAAQVATDNAGVSATPNVFIAGGIYKDSFDTYNDNDAVPFHFDVNGRLITSVELNDYTDDSNEFTVTSSKVLAIAGVATADAVDAGDVGALRMTVNRNLGVDISEQSLTAVKVSKDANANLVTDAIFVQISDQITGVGVIAATTALKTDMSSIAGTTPSVNAGAMDAGTQRFTLATDDTHFGTLGAASDVDGVTHGQLRYIGEATNNVETAVEIIDNMVYVDEATFAATTSSGVALMGWYQTADDSVTTGQVGALHMTADRHLKVRPDGYDTSTDSVKAFEISPLDQHYVEESLVDTTNLAAAANYYPASTGALVGSYKDFSFTGKFIEGAGETITMLVQGMNDEDTASGDWITVYGYRDDANTTVASVVATNATVTYSWSFNNFNYKYYRIVVTPDSATNTAIVKLRKKAL